MTEAVPSTLDNAGDHEVIQVIQPVRAQRWITVLDGTRLREARRQHGLSRATLADRAGLSIATVARLEGQRMSSCRCRTLVRLAAALGEDPSVISYGEPG
jgi:DNA-binding XRE family transcriptional regulator